MLLSGVEVAEKLGISNSNFHQNFKPHLPTYQIGGKAYYMMKDVEEFIKQNKTSPKHTEQKE